MKEQTIYNSQALRLLKNVTYPAYQLYAIAGYGKDTPDTVLKIAVLETIMWLRNRFRDFEVPKELQWPDSSEHKEVHLSDFCSFVIDKGYKVEVIWLYEERIWTLQLTEPDLGPNPGEKIQTRQPVPGRIFETNVAYHIVNGQVECGFRTFVSDPEGTQEKAEAFRLGFIKKLVRNKEVGLHHCCRLSDEAVQLDNMKAIQNFTDCLTNTERMLPCVIIAACNNKTHVQDMIKAQCNTKSTSNYSDTVHVRDLIKMSVHTSVFNACAKSAGNTTNEPLQYPLNSNDLAHYRMGYALFYNLHPDYIEKFIEITGYWIASGDVLLLEPFRITREQICICYEEIKRSSEDSFIKIDTWIRNYPIDKPVNYRHVVFLPAAKEIDRGKIARLAASKEELIATHIEQIEAIRNTHKNENLSYRETIEIKDKKLERLESKINELEEMRKKEQSETAEKYHLYEKALNDSKEENTRLELYQKRPCKCSDIAAWVNKRFDDKLILHSKAAELLKQQAQNTVDMKILCDALEYLATDYRDELLGVIDLSERDCRCKRKFNRPFEVTPITEETVKAFPNDYTIRYQYGSNNKANDCPLNLHLKIGNVNENLLRVYFLYDKIKKLIVVGSLPKHLSTNSYH